MKNLSLILAIAFIAMFSTVKAEEEILWKSRYNMIIDKNGDINPGYIRNAIFTPDDKFLILSCEFKTFLVESETGKYLKDIPFSGVIRFSNDGKYFYTTSGEKVNFETNEIVGTFKINGKSLPNFAQIDVSEKAGIMVGLIQSKDYTNWKKDIYIFDLKTMEFIDTLGDSSNFYINLTLAQNANFFITYSEVVKDLNSTGERVFTSNLWDSKLLKNFSNSKGIANTMTTSKDGKWIGSVNGSYVSIYEALTYKKLFKIMQLTSKELLSGVSFSNDSKYLATGGTGVEDDVNDIHVWDVETGNLSYRYSNGTKKITASPNYCYSNQGRYLLGWGDKNIVLYNAIYTTTKIDPLINTDTTQIYPNPSNQKVSIEINNLPNSNYKLLSQTGNEIDITSISSVQNNKLEIEIASLAIGNYYLVLTQNNTSKLYKFIKE